MSVQTTIEWTDATWNPVTGCTKVSAGCQHCYAERFAERFRGVPGHPYSQGFDLKLWRERLGQPLSWRRPRRVFVNSMSDLFHEDVPLEFIQQVFGVMASARHHFFQVLTKRAKRLADICGELEWPENVWMGVSVENQDCVWRVDCLRRVPAKVRFVSLEPLLGPVVLDLTDIHWVIVGGESGPGARPMEAEWVRRIKAQSQRAGVAFFFKQWGGKRKNEAGRVLYGRLWDEMPSVVAVGAE